MIKMCMYGTFIKVRNVTRVSDGLNASVLWIDRYCGVIDKDNVMEAGEA